MTITYLLILIIIWYLNVNIIININRCYVNIVKCNDYWRLMAYYSNHGFYSIDRILF